ncbi:MAG TPA: integrase core domain-containing protein [Chloroflexota bacterium]|jgi:transposase InsO family protein|nr:integrase core domain-containing protein [Chloroflexota bacterium]
MLVHLLHSVHGLADAAFRAFRRRLGNALRPATTNSLVLGAATDLVRGKPELVAENALLRQQLIILTRSTKRPRLTRSDRALLVLLASRVRAWRQALLIVQPATVLRWHRAGFRLVWRWRSAPRSRQARVSPQTVVLIRRMARENRLWGAERIRGELLKLGIAVGKRTVQRHMRGARPPRPAGQTWATFLRTHGREIWACDFLQLTELLFRPVFAFFVVELGSRRVVHVGVTRAPSDAWVAQQLREATPEGVGPRYLVHDHDAKYGPAFARVAAASAIEVILTPVRAPRANAVGERFLRSVRRECTDHALILGERHLRRTLTEYVAYFNRSRPHQGIGQRTPRAPQIPVSPGRSTESDGVLAVPVLGGLHHDYRAAA